MTPDERSRLTAELARLEASYTDMISGDKAAEIGSGGRMVKYAPGNAAALMARIASIKRQLGLPGSRRMSITPHF